MSTEDEELLTFVLKKVGWSKDQAQTLLPCYTCKQTGCTKTQDHVIVFTPADAAKYHEHEVHVRRRLYGACCICTFATVDTCDHCLNKV